MFVVIGENRRRQKRLLAVPARSLRPRTTTGAARNPRLILPRGCARTPGNWQVFWLGIQPQEPPSHGKPDRSGCMLRCPPLQRRGRPGITPGSLFAPHLNHQMQRPELMSCSGTNWLAFTRECKPVLRSHYGWIVCSVKLEFHAVGLVCEMAMHRAGPNDASVNAAVPDEKAAQAARPGRKTAARATAESPCIKLCQLDLASRCRGCGRTLDEIRDWSGMTLQQRSAVNARLGFSGHERVD